MSVSYIPESVKIRLWGKAAGRCEYKGCNDTRWIDCLTKFEFNSAYIAHIVADKPEGPRGDAVLSEQLKADLGNLMLLCDAHHRLIDHGDVVGHPVGVLRTMKHDHEMRIELLTSMQDDHRSHVLLFGANIGEANPHLSMEKSQWAMSSTHYPHDNRPIDLGMRNSALKDNDARFWENERENLRAQFNAHVKQRLALVEIKHFSIFGLAPIPLLMELGALLSDIPAAEVYQLHREPSDWKWQEDPQGFEYVIREPVDRKKTVSLNLSLSATIDDDRISKAMGDDRSAWTITIANPNNDFLKGRGQLRKFREIFRDLLNRIKLEHGEDSRIHIFPAVPVSIALEMGRVRMPKAELPFSVYDHNRISGGFVHALDIGPSIP